jgi:hypothetical protein
MNRISLVVILGLATLNCFAQNTVVSGQVIDEKGKETIPYVTVSIVAEGENDIITGTVTDDKGARVKIGAKILNHRKLYSFVPNSYPQEKRENVTG